jgi:hypothetical protein
VADGSLARSIILPTEDDYPEEALGRGIRTAPTPLIEQLRLVAAGGGHVPSGNLAGLGAGTSTGADPMIVPMTPEAGRVFAELGSDITRELREARGTGNNTVLARVSENAHKLALVAAVSRDPVAPEITIYDAEWAIGFVRRFARNTIRAVDQRVADNEIERNQQKVLDIIRRAGPGGLTKLAAAARWHSSITRCETPDMRARRLARASVCTLPNTVRRRRGSARSARRCAAAPGRGRRGWRARSRGCGRAVRRSLAR